MVREDFTKKVMFEHKSVRAGHTAPWREKCFSQREQQGQDRASGADRARGVIRGRTDREQSQRS